MIPGHLTEKQSQAALSDSETAIIWLLKKLICEPDFKERNESKKKKKEINRKPIKATIVPGTGTKEKKIINASDN